MTLTERRLTTAEWMSQSPALPWLRRHGVVAAALVLIVLQLWWRADLLRHSFFAEDDFELVVRAAENGLGWDYLMRSHAGHIMPGGFALAWALTRLDPYSWTLASAATLLLQACASVAVLYLLRLLFGARPAILVPLTVYLFTPLTIPATTWWATALNVVPFQVALPLALASHVRYVRDGRFRHAVAAAAWVVVGLAFFLKAAALPVLLFAVTSAYLVEGPWRFSAWATLRRFWRAWALYGGVLVAYVVVYLLQRHTSDTAARLPGSPRLTVEFAWKLVVRTFVPGALGGPWEWRPLSTNHALAATPTALVVVSGLVTAALVAVSVAYRRHAWRAWVILLGYVLLVDVVPVSLGRLFAWGSEIGLETRYVADAAPVLALCLGLAFLPLAGEREPFRRPLPAGAAAPTVCGLLVGAFLVGTVWSVNGFRDDLHGERIKAYLNNADQALAGASDTTEIYDAKVPRYAMQPTFGDYALASRLLAPLASPDARRAMEKEPPYRSPEIFDDEGRLHPMKVVGVQSGPGPGRGPLLNGCWVVTNRTTTVRLPAPVVRGEWMMQLGYFVPRTATVQVWFGGERVNVVLTRRGGQWGDQLFFTVRGGGTRVQITGLTPLKPTERICVGGLTVGVPRP